ncbi:hypothetical protein Godav_025874, partial [Gossypium davidsonii]|nr:hypothetical protein [Gossypium davidsonii]MBA0673605.1 hypothetical protein [Gossypium klotzschianum]
MEEKPTTKQLLETHQYFDDNIDDVPVRDTRSLSKIYERCNVVVFEFAEFQKAEKDDKRIEAMREKQFEAFQVKGQEEKVYMLNKASYGLKQTSKAWYNRINRYHL